MVKLNPDKVNPNKAYAISFEQTEDIVDLVYRVHKFNFSGYSRALLKRRVTRIMNMYELSLSDLRSLITNNPTFYAEFLMEMTVSVTEMFSNPAGYRAIREEVLPALEPSKRIKVWSAGCATGEEVYSLAIILEQSKLYNKSFIYGTDLHPHVLNIAKKGVYDLKKMKISVENFQATDPSTSLKNFYTVKKDNAAIDVYLKKNTLFSIHNLVSDKAFNEFQLISCRNVLIYFNVSLQQEVFKLFYDSLSVGGFLCLGPKESLRGDDLLKHFKVVDQHQKIYQKID